ncbi:MAG: Bug family tripartite tricarboxylate transporter substrate binding protein [Bordetella sp.]|uniref:Bug family tripartite tricarboxylate transporter substrate binding protein n=1 Tax=Bordetella sp. TaxID=28081 RepID=UPI003F7B72D6
MKIRLLTALGAGTLLLAMQGPACAQDTNWPTRPLRMLVGSSPGGGTDAFARATAQGLTPLLHQNVVVENRPGASNTLANAITATSTDGNTMVMGVSTAMAIAPHLFKLSYKHDDLVPVVFAGAVPNVLVVNNDLPARNVQELVALLKRNPGHLNFASSGVGSTQHIAAELFMDATGTKMVHVPYQGSGPAMVDLMAGQVQVDFETAASAIPFIKSGKLRALAVLSAKRLSQIPDVPTLAQAGVPDLEMGAWYGIYMPAKTPPAVQKTLHDAVNRVLAMPTTQKILDAIGAEVTPMSQRQFIAFDKTENARYAAVIEKNHITVR